MIGYIFKSFRASRDIFRFKKLAFLSSIGSDQVKNIEQIVPTIEKKIKVSERIRNSKPMTFLSGSLVGFFAGLSLAATTAYIGMYESYQKTSSIVLNDVVNLSNSVSKISKSFDKINALEDELNKLRSESTSRQDLQAVEKGLITAVNEVNLSLLDLKSKITSGPKTINMIDNNPTEDMSRPV